MWHRAQFCVIYVGANGTAHRDHGVLAPLPSEDLDPVIPQFQWHTNISGGTCIIDSSSSRQHCITGSLLWKHALCRVGPGHSREHRWWWSWWWLMTMKTSSQKTRKGLETTHVLVVCEDALGYPTPSPHPAALLLKVIHVMWLFLPLKDHWGSLTEMRKQVSWAEPKYPTLQLVLHKYQPQELFYLHTAHKQMFTLTFIDNEELSSVFHALCITRHWYVCYWSGNSAFQRSLFQWFGKCRSKQLISSDYRTDLLLLQLEAFKSHWWALRWSEKLARKRMSGGTSLSFWHWGQCVSGSPF